MEEHQVGEHLNKFDIHVSDGMQPRILKKPYIMTSQGHSKSWEADLNRGNS